MRGRIQVLFPTGWGFIAVPGQKDHYFNAKALSPLTVGFGDLEPGDYVEFDSIDAPKGKRAVCVVLMGKVGELQQAVRMEAEDGETETR